ncbi:pirin family protein [Microbacterium sp. DT81.1]|uniref:pirin family protein n=1 Tax=Microbacterium sp. DT81.1 TaxID=3393413 RepID=UPI003CEFDAA8
MTRLDSGPDASTGLSTGAFEDAPALCDGPRALVLESREVPLGGVRGMAVHRALPQRDLPMVGAWCFLDRFGPQRARMRVEPHPHIGLQTVTWPFTGDVRHRDSVGSDVFVRRGALNLMTSGRGISHSEYSIGEDEVKLDALQLWVALPESRRHGGPAFEQHAQLPQLHIAATRTAEVIGASEDRGSSEDFAAHAVVVMGEFAGVVSPASAYTPIVGAEVRVSPGTRVRLPLKPEWEYALLAVDGDISADADAAASALSWQIGDLLYLGISRDHIDVTSASGATVFVLGGEPFPDEIVMWWNFVGRDHDEIVEAREEWEGSSERFGQVIDHGDERIPAPPLPAVRLTPRRRRA